MLLNTKILILFLIISVIILYIQKDFYTNHYVNNEKIIYKNDYYNLIDIQIINKIIFNIIILIIFLLFLFFIDIIHNFIIYIVYLILLVYSIKILISI